MSSIAQPVARSVSRSVLAGQQINLGYLIRSMFSNSEQGFAYDINDLSTLYQDALGTIPVTGAGQPVGLVLDKSKGLVLGDELSVNGDFSDNGTGWTIYGAPTVSYSGGVANVSFIGNTPGCGIYQDFSVPAGSLVKITARGRSIATAGGISIRDGGSFNTTHLNFPFPVSETFTSHTFYVFSNTGSLRLYFYINGQVNPSAQFDSITCKVIAGNHAYQTTSSCRPLLQRNATTGAYYLAFDGVDDFLVTNSIDFTMTDKLSVFAGVRKLSDVNIGIAAELGNVSTSVRFTIQAPPTAGQKKYLMAVSFGSLQAGTTAANYASPTSNVLTTRADGLSKLLNLRIDGFSYLNAIREMGANKLGNYPLYIGRRGGTSLPFNGHIYSLIGIGRLTSDSETIALEKAIAKNVGVTL